MKKITTVIVNEVLWNHLSSKTLHLLSAMHKIKVVSVLLKYPKVLIFSDDIYEKVLYDNNKFYTIATVEPKLKNRTITMNGVSKAYCMTGWRLGYCGGQKEIILGMNKIQSQSTTSTSSISMAAAVEALNGNQDFILIHNQHFKKRRDMIVEKLNNIPGIACDIPQGAFYVYPCCAGCIDKKTSSGKIIKSDEDFMDYLLDSEGIAGVHGKAFGLSPYFRLSYAADEQTLIDACDRIMRACKKLS